MIHLNLFKALIAVSLVAGTVTVANLAYAGGYNNRIRGIEKYYTMQDLGGLDLQGYCTGQRKGVYQKDFYAMMQDESYNDNARYYQERKINHTWVCNNNGQLGGRIFFDQATLDNVCTFQNKNGQAFAWNTTGGRYDWRCMEWKFNK
jgi:hypothetical protein